MPVDTAPGEKLACGSTVTASSERTSEGCACAVVKVLCRSNMCSECSSTNFLPLWGRRGFCFLLEPNPWYKYSLLFNISDLPSNDLDKHKLIVHPEKKKLICLRWKSVVFKVLFIGFIFNRKSIEGNRQSTRFKTGVNSVATRSLALVLVMLL